MKDFKGKKKTNNYSGIIRIHCNQIFMDFMKIPYQRIYILNEL